MFYFFKIPKSNISPISQNFKQNLPILYLLKPFERESKYFQKIREIKTPT